MEIRSLREHPEELESFIAFFARHWGNEPLYRQCMSACLETDSPLPQWYRMTGGDADVGGVGLITNDFNARMDRMPWICALYVEEPFRGKELGGVLLNHARKEAGRLGFRHVYLTTDHRNYYEKYSFRYEGPLHDPFGSVSRMYTARAMPDVRFHGSGPYRIAFLHGGPGAPGSVGDPARDLAALTLRGVLEPMQDGNTVEELLAELKRQLESGGGDGPFVLIGHSWGAWLAGLFAERHPEMVERLILIGGGPLRPGTDIDAIRRARFSAEETQHYRTLLKRLADCASGEEKDPLLKSLGALCEKADAFELCEPSALPSEDRTVDGARYAALWAEGAAMRSSGELEERFARIRVPIVLIHGADDPHPADGIAEVLRERGIPFREHRLLRCGHSPWKERFARDRFFALLELEVRDRSGR